MTDPNISTQAVADYRLRHYGGDIAGAAESLRLEIWNLTEYGDPFQRRDDLRAALAIVEGISPKDGAND